MDDCTEGTRDVASGVDRTGATPHTRRPCDCRHGFGPREHAMSSGRSPAQNRWAPRRSHRSAAARAVTSATVLTLRAAFAVAAVGLLCGAVVVSCAGDAPGSAPAAMRPASRALGQWTPLSGIDTCSKEFHDSFFVVGPDGKRYPTWHRPEEIDPATGVRCTFGHDHGLDPRGSDLWPDLQRHFAFDADGSGTLDEAELAASGIPFGYVAEQLEGSATPRLEAHTGYKVIYANDVRRMRLVDGQPQTFDLSCDLFALVQQGTASADAFASNLHSVTYAIDCNSGAARSQYPVKLIVSAMATYGNPGGFTIFVNGQPAQQPAGTAAPPNSPPGGTELGRQIPTFDRIAANLLVPAGQTSNDDAALAERWDTRITLRRADGSVLATVDPGFTVFTPPRYFDVNRGLAHTIEICYGGLNAAGQFITDPLQAGTIVRRARGGACGAIAPNGPATPLPQRIAFDDPASPFNACRRDAIFRDNVVRNGGGATIWYTDAFGAGGRTTAFGGSVKQFVASATVDALWLAEVRATLPFCQSPSVHAPN